MKKGKFNKQLLVEGKDDQHVIWALCELFGVKETFDVVDCGGIDEVSKEIPIRLKQSEIKSIGIIIDADTDINLRYTTLKDTILKSINYSFPEIFPNEGLVIRLENYPTIGIWIMPNNNLNGMIEDFISFLIPNTDLLLPEVELFLDSIESKNLSKYKNIHKSKAIIHSWLATQENPGTPMGLAITKKYLDSNNENCIRLINWINTVFNS